MKKIETNIVITALLAIVIFPGSGAAAVEPNPEAKPTQLTVRFFNEAQMKESIWRKAQANAERILSRAGVGIRWIDCNIDLEKALPICKQDLGPNEITIRIFPKAHGRTRSLSFNAIAKAIRLGKESGTGLIGAYADRVKNVARALRMSSGFVFGTILAHEIGHLLLPTMKHSRGGIMKANLTMNEWNAASQGALGFGKEEIREIQEGFYFRAQSEVAP